VQGKKVFDPRDDSTAYSANVALCLLDYLKSTAYGLSCTDDEIDEASFIAAANICDEAVAKNGGGTEARYTINGSFETSATPRSIIDEIVKCMAGACYYAAGKWSCKAGAYESPAVTLTDAMMTGPIEVQAASGIRDTCNSVRGTFSNPLDKWQMAELPAQVSATWQTNDAGEIWDDIELALVTIPGQGQRIEKIHLYSRIYSQTVKVRCNLQAMAIQAGDVFAVTHARFGWTAKTFRCEEWKPVVGSGDNPSLEIELIGREVNSSIYSWTSTDEEIVAASANTNLPNPWTVAAPSGMTVTAGTAEQIVGSDGATVCQMLVAWSAPADEAVTSGGAIEIEYKKHADATWLPAGSVPGNNVAKYIAPVEDAVSYDVQIRSMNSMGAVSAWVQVLNTTVTAITLSAPSNPTAPTYDSAGTTIAADGTSTAWVAMQLAVLPAGASAQDLLFKLHASATWESAGRFFGSAVGRISGLACGVAYDIAVVAVSPFGFPSAVVQYASNPYTTANIGSNSAVPTSVALSTVNVPPAFYSGTTSRLFGSRVTWAAPADKTIIGYEVKATYNNADTDTTYTWTDGSGNVMFTSLLSLVIYSLNLTAGYVWVRSVDRSGNRSAWVAGGNANGTASLGPGSLAEQNSNAAAVTGLKIGGGSSTTNTTAVVEGSAVVTFAGGAPSEDFTIALANRGFSYAPTSGLLSTIGDRYLVVFQFQHGSNSSTIAYCRIWTTDGSNLPAGDQRILYRFME
jgi:hypothetical protein